MQEGVTLVDTTVSQDSPSREDLSTVEEGRMSKSKIYPAEKMKFNKESAKSSFRSRLNATKDSKDSPPMTTTMETEDDDGTIIVYYK